MAPLSSRAKANIAPSYQRSFMARVFSNPYNAETNPNGIFQMGLAENKLMHSELSAYITSHTSVTSHMLTYGDGPTGSPELHNALAGFINNTWDLNLDELVKSEHVTVLNGVCSVIDALAFCIAEPGEGVLIAQPIYAGFLGDFEDRAGVKVVPVPMKGAGIASLEAVGRHEEALLKARKEGINVKGLLLCNPQNPLGKCYEREVLLGYLRLCEKYQIHLISDEIYAHSIFPTKSNPGPQPFLSILSLPYEESIDPSLVHMVYGMSKDFCANGLRIGALISQHNPTLHEAIASVAKFSWASSMSSQAWTSILLDKKFLEFYFKEMRVRMGIASDLCSTILTEMRIPYVPSNCGPFIWTDLRSFLEEKTIGGERRLADKMLDCGVWLATGEAFVSEEPGWFRITFAVPEEELRFGFGRLKKALGLKEVEATP